MNRTETHRGSDKGLAPHATGEARPPLIEAQKLSVQEIMSRQVVTTRADVSLESIVEMMLETGVSRIPVVDERDRLVGILSKTDLIEQQHDQGDTSEENARIPWRRGISFPEKGMHVHNETATVADVMKPGPITITESSSVARAAELMCRHELHGLPVVSSEGKVIGMISPLDIARWVAGLV